MFKVKPFQLNCPFLYPLKTSENERFSDVFRGYRNGTLHKNGLLANPPEGHLSEVYTEPCKTSKVEHLAKIFND